MKNTVIRFRINKFLEVEGKQKGSISIKKVNENTAQLGLFLVEPDIRGAGNGQQLVQTAIDFCKELIEERWELIMEE